jgi:hypothetical protein
MKAGAVEMRGIVKFLLTKAGCTVPEVPASALDDWTRTFGSTRDYSSAGLDLIAFSAAVKARTGQLARGNLKLSEKDATDAVQQHYLGPIKSDHTRANILRLAVLSDLESPVSVRALPFPSVGFSRECVDRGLVVARNGMYSLAHPALGRLLSAAAGTNVSEERLAAARSSSILTARMLRRGLFESERENLLRQLKHSLITGEWVDSCVQLHDISSILSVAARMNIIDSTISDQLISEDARIAELARGARSLETFISVAGHLRSRHFSKTANRILDITDPVSGPALLENLVQGGTGQVLALLKNFPSPKYICSAIELERWNRSREGLAIDLASSTAQMARFVEQVGYPALATAPARQFIFRAEKSQLFNSDLGDVSNIVRHARADEVLLCSFFERLIGSGWLSQAYRTTKQGQLCGALMSFANHLPPAVRQVIQLPEIQVRIAVEARQILSENPVTVARFTCLLGAASALWGSGFEATSWQWPVELAISTVFESRAPRSTDGEALGMYELQFWLGLRWLSENESALPRLTKHSLGESFLRRLEQSVSPSREAMVVRTELLRWLAERQAAGWQLIRA